MAASLFGKKIWIVGASVGIGEALAHALAKNGAHLILSSRDKEKLQHLLTVLPGSGHASVPVDVTDPQSVQAAWTAVNTLGKIDTLIYNAGFYEPMSAVAFDLPKVERMLDVNFHGALRVLACILPYFVQRREGHIALVGSVAGYRGLPNACGYGASKAALIHLAENLCFDLREHAIKVQIINPGFVKTRLTDKNTFPMPFIMTAEAAALRIVKGLCSESFDINFPKRLSYVLKILRCLPYRLYFGLLKNLRG